MTDCSAHPNHRSALRAQDPGLRCRRAVACSGEQSVRLSLAAPVRDLGRIAQGTAGQSPAAWRDLRASIVQHVQRNAPWPETRLVVTGDLSTWGDNASIEQAIQLANSIAQDAGLPEPLLIHGNHDVWAGLPGTLGDPSVLIHRRGESRCASNGPQAAILSRHYGGRDTRW